jgi:regulator of protease activity HflC (stomatin/prohibitin superfamily)
MDGSKMVQESGSEEKNGSWGKIKQGLVRDRAKLLAVLFIILFFIVFFAPSIFITIAPGHTGVLFRRLWGGTVADRVYSEGLHIISPWNKMYPYDARIQALRQEVDILSKNGLTVLVTVSVRYHIVRDQAAMLHQQVGPDYREKIIIPSTISSVREVIGTYNPEELYTTARQVIQDDILVEEIEETGRIPIIYDDIIVENIKLPDLINQAIEDKLRQQQEYLAYEFKIAKEREEAKRKQIEAEGIKTYQDIISKHLSGDLLSWLGIRATLELSKSPNAKVIVIGNSKNGLPIILNASETANLQPSETPSQEEQNAMQGTGDRGGPSRKGAGAAGQATGVSNRN